MQIINCIDNYKPTKQYGYQLEVKKCFLIMYVKEYL